MIETQETCNWCDGELIVTEKPKRRSLGESSATKYRAVCRGCGAIGPDAYTVEGALRKFNREIP